MRELTYKVVGKTAPPDAPGGFKATVTDAGVVLSWNANLELDFKEYVISVNGQPAETTSATQWTYPNTPAGITNFSIVAVDTTGNVSTTPATTQSNILPPGIPTLGYHFSSENIILEIGKPASQLSIDHYEIRWGGSSWETATSLGNTYASVFSVLGAWLGDRTFWVAATDIGGNTGAAQSAPVTIVAPCMPPSMSIQIIDNNVLLYWGESTGSLPVATYEVRRGEIFNSALVIGKKSGGFTTIFETRAGNFVYWVAAIDTAGNYSEGAQRSATVAQPPDYVLKISSDSLFTGGSTNVLTPADMGSGLNLWDNIATVTLLPLAWQSARTKYQMTEKAYWEVTVDYNPSNTLVRAGISKTGYATSNATALGNDASSLGYGWDIDGTVRFNNASVTTGLPYVKGDVLGFAFDPVAHTLALYRNNLLQYTITGLGAGPWHPTLSLGAIGLSSSMNFGEAHFVFAAPIGYGGMENAKLDTDGSVLFPINLTETFQQHFTVGHTWATPQAQIDATYPIFAQPGYLTGYYEEVIDLEEILAAMKITASYSGNVIAGSPSVVMTISTKRLITDAWVDNVGVTEFYGSDFQFVKVRITVTGDDHALYRLLSLNTRLDAKLKDDAGMVTCAPGGTIVNFAVPFIDVTSVMVTPGGTSSVTALYDFHEVDEDLAYTVAANVITVQKVGQPYVVGQKVKLNFMTGTAPSGIYPISAITANSFSAALVTANTSGQVSIYPESMRVFLFNSTNGAAVSGPASWSLKGY